ncbi:putative Exocyst complex, component Exoc1 protein, partial [Trachipleistophora hominis]
VQSKLEIDLYKLNRLSAELEDVQNMNNTYETEINNKEKLRDALSELVRMLEIDEKYFSYFENDNYGDAMVMSRIEESLYMFDCVLGCQKDDHRVYAYNLNDFNLKVANEFKKRILDVKKTFYKKFGHFFTKKLNSYKSKSKGELKIHKDIYDEVIKYKSFMTQEYVEIYIKCMKKLYSHEFRYHLESVFDILKRKKNVTLSVNLNVIFQSLLLIRECEYDFIRKISKKSTETHEQKNDEQSSEDETNSVYFATHFKDMDIFDDVVIMIQTFLADLYELDRFQTIIALGDSIQHYREKTKEELRSGFYERFLESVLNNYKNLRKDFVRLAISKYKGENKKKTIQFFNKVILSTKDDELREKMVHYHTKLVLKLSKDYKTDFQHVLRKFECVYPIRKCTDYYFLLVEEMKKIIIDEMFAVELDYVRIKKNVGYIMRMDDEEMRNAALKIFKGVVKDNTNDAEYRRIEPYF